MKNRHERVYRGRRNDMSHKLFDRTCQANGLLYVGTTQTWCLVDQNERPLGTILVDVTPKTTRRALLMSLLAKAERTRGAGIAEEPAAEAPTTETAPDEALNA